MFRQISKFIKFKRIQIRGFGSEPDKNSSASRHIDKTKNVVYGGDLPVSTATKSFGSLLFEKLMKPGRENEILQICTSSKYGITTRRFLEKAVAVAERLREEGINKGDYVGLVGNNSIRMNISLAGIFFLGAVPFPITHKTTIDEFKILLKGVRPKFFACDQANLFTLHQILRSVGDYDSSKIYLLDGDKYSTETGAECFADFIKDRGKNINAFKPASIDNPKNELALIMKGARHQSYGKAIGITHYNLNSVIARFQAIDPDEMQKKVVLMVQKVMWMSGVYCFIKACFFESKLIVMSEFEEESFLEAIEEYKVTSSYIYVEKLWRLYKYNFTREYDLSSCQYLQAFDGFLPPHLISGMKEKMGLVLKPSYGINELTGLALQPIHVQNDGKDGQAAELVPQMYGKVISDKTLRMAGPYEKGEICFKGPVVTKGYINDAPLTRKLFDKDGFLLTGLYGYYDNDGYFFIIDNIHLVIKYKEQEISPRHLEGVIKSLEPVKDVLVAGIQHPTDGFYPIAFVSVQKGKSITANEILTYVNKKVDEHEKLRGGVVFLPKIPRSRDTGALKRTLLVKVLSKYRILNEVEYAEEALTTESTEKTAAIEKSHKETGKVTLDDFDEAKEKKKRKKIEGDPVAPFDPITSPNPDINFLLGINT